MDEQVWCRNCTEAYEERQTGEAPPVRSRRGSLRKSSKTRGSAAAHDRALPSHGTKRTGGGAGGAAAAVPVLRDDPQRIRDRIEQGQEACAGCSGLIVASAVEAMGSIWHPECLKCSHCGEVLDAAGGLKRNPKRPTEGYHSECYTRAFASRCWACDEPLQGRFVKYNDNKYHKECFTCAKCAGALSGGFVEKEGSPWCPACARAARQAPAVSASTFTGGNARSEAALRDLAASVAPPAAAAAPAAVVCTACAEPIAGDHKFCQECGTPAPRTSGCPGCGYKANNPGAKFCAECGARQ